MSTIRIKSTELVRKFSDLKALAMETGSKIVVEEYKKPVLVIFPSDEFGDPISVALPKDMEEMERLRKKLQQKKIKVSAVNFS